MAFTFEKLHVYQKAMSFADEVCTLTRKSPTRLFLSRRPTKSPRAFDRGNIAEGNGRFTTPDRRTFFGIARGSVQECVPLLELAARQEIFSQDSHTKLKDELEEIARMLSGLISGMEKRHR